MYKELRPRTPHGELGSTPEFWADVFARSGRLTLWRRFRLRLSGESEVLLRHLPRGGRILDAGCGFGEWVMFLQSEGFRAEGLDYSDELVGRLRQEYPGVAWTVSDISEMPYEDRSFDGVLSLGVVEHNEGGPVAALREMYRILRPGGVAIITVPRDYARQREASRRQYPSERGETFFQYFMTNDELAAFMKEAGFQPVATGTLRSPSLALLAPSLSTKLPRRVHALAALGTQIFFRWTKRYDGMIYCVGQR